MAERPATRRARRREAVAAWGFVSPAVLVVLGLSLVPFGWALLLSFRKQGFSGPSEFVGLRNYDRLLTKDPVFATAVSNTLRYTVAFVPVSLALGLAIAILLNQRVRFVGFYRTLIFAPFVASAAATGLLFGIVFDTDFGIANAGLGLIGISRQGFFHDPDQALWALVIVSLWQSVGFNVVLYLAALQDVPPELREAAAIDGAGPWATFRSIVLPHLGPVTLFLTLYNTLNALQLFDLVYASTHGGPLHATTTVVYYVYQQAFKYFHAGYGSAAAWLLALAILAIGVLEALWYRRRGLTGDVA
jgi:multiple sugar transport system permease protein